MVADQYKEPLPENLSDVKCNNLAYLRIKLMSSSDWCNEWTRRVTKQKGKQSCQEYQNNTEQSLDVKEFTIFKPMEDLFIDAVDYRQYRLIKKWEGYDDDMVDKLSCMNEKLAIWTNEKL